MAKHMTNAALGDFLFNNNHDNADGSNLYIKRMCHGVPFFVLSADVVSYRTVVATLVQNLYTGHRELWVSSKHYSSTTARQLGYIRAGAFRAGVPVYAMSFADPVVTRIGSGHLERAIAYAAGNMRAVNKPRLHDTTREDLLRTASTALQTAVDLVTADINVEQLNAYTQYKLREAREMDCRLRGWLEMPTPMMRAVVSGYLALCEENGCVELG